MEHYVTLFDSLFLPQGLALHVSLERHAGPYVLWVLCMDEASRSVLERLALPNVRLLSIADCETDSLRAVKKERSRVEYYWTLSPFTTRFVFERDPSATRATYVDADLWLRRHPSPLFAEMERAGKQVLITEHAYAPGFDQSEVSGRFCVQFMTFTRSGEPVRKWWEERCIEWCFVRPEDGKFGDQKYLDEFPVLFGDLVHVLGAKEAMQAPWNASRFDADDAVAYHFHGLRLLDDGWVSLDTAYPIPRKTHRRVYEPYLRDLGQAVDRIRSAGHVPLPQMKVEPRPFLRRRVSDLIRGLRHPSLARRLARLPRRSRQALS